MASKGKTIYPTAPAPGYDHDRYGTWPRDMLFRFEGFISSFDSRDDDTGDGTGDYLAVPHWVAYEIKRHGPPYKSPKPSPDRPKPWYEMTALNFLAEEQGIQDEDINRSYRGWGTSESPLPALGNHPVNRGHMAMKSHVQRIGWREACNTHVFVNSVPQQAEMNQGDWLHLEAYSGAAANKYGRVWVIAGPIFDKGKPITYMSNKRTASVPVAIPDAVFKILIKENEAESVPDVLALIFPQPSDHYVECKKAKRQGYTYDAAQYLTSVAEIEEKTGLEFFRNVLFAKKNRKHVRAAFVAQTASALWPVEDEFAALTCP